MSRRCGVAPSVAVALALTAGILGSFLGGLIIALFDGRGFEFRPSGIIGSLVGRAVFKKHLERAGIA